VSGVPDRRTVAPGGLRILQTESSPNWGGQEERLLRESLWLRRNGHTVAIAAPRGSPLESKARAAGFEWYPLPAESHLSLTGILGMRRIGRHFRPDVVQTHSGKDSWLALWLLPLGVAIVRSRNISMPSRTGVMSGLIFRFGCHRVVAVSDLIKRDLIGMARVPEERVDVVGSAVDLSEFHPGRNGGGFRAEFGIPPDAPLFGVVAMLRGEKGQNIFLKAAIRAHRENPAFRFVIVGEPIASSDIGGRLRERIAKAFPNGDSPIVLTGFRTDVPEVMAALDVLVVPSLHEAQSLVIPQAFATRRAVIASRVGGIPELVSHGENGLLVDPKDADGLASAMLELGADAGTRARFGARGYELAIEELAFDRKMGQLMDSFGAAIAVSRRATRGR